MGKQEGLRVPREDDPPRDTTRIAHLVCGVGYEQLLHRNVQRFRGGLVFKAHRLLYHSILGLRVIKKKKKG